MPFYEYECQDCKLYTELMQKITDPPLEKCPSCGKKTMQKLISAPVFRLKGSGWYATDYARSGSSPKKDLDGDKAKTESKPAESKSTESKSTESKSTESKSSESKAESKPAGASTKND